MDKYQKKTDEQNGAATQKKRDLREILMAGYRNVRRNPNGGYSGSNSEGKKGLKQILNRAI